MSTQRKRTVVAVDDDDINLLILAKSVEDAGYAVKTFTSGDDAWNYMTRHPTSVDIALLDKMMPGLNGLDLLKRIKAHIGLKHMPVILQTGDVGLEQMREGLENGAYYYLTKPFHPEILVAILQSAASECTLREKMLAEARSGHTQFLTLLQDGHFALKTHEEARGLATTLSQAAAYPEFVALGLMELFANAIEHGNLEIGYQQKRKWLMEQQWDKALAARMEIAEYHQRSVKVTVEKSGDGFNIIITDDGPGFDWRHHMYNENTPSLNEPNGRGIAKAMIMLDELHYVGKGNEAHCHIHAGEQRQLPGRDALSNRLHN